MNKLLVICGPTATGKTSLALHLTKLMNGEIISADSRQVYKFMDIGTGKDIPDSFNFAYSNIREGKINIGYYTNGRTRLWGFDLVDPKSDFSVGQYEGVVTKILKDIYKRHKFPILVGGTGLYIKAAVDGIGTSGVPQNVNLRKLLNKKDAAELFEILSHKDYDKAAGLNSSDKKNSRRLVRAIEVADWKENNPTGNQVRKVRNVYKTLFIGLTIDRKKLAKIIEKRVRERINKGIENEISKILSRGVKWNDQSMNTLGYKEWLEYFRGTVKREVVIKKWISNEINYSKRQTTWFKKDKRIMWFNIGTKSWKNDIEKMVMKWHNEI